MTQPISPPTTPTASNPKKSTKPSGSKIIPSALNAKDIPSQDGLFLYIALQEMKGDHMSWSDWEAMATLSDGALKPKSWKNMFSATRKHAKLFIEEKMADRVLPGELDKAKTSAGKKRKGVHDGEDGQDVGENGKPAKKAKTGPKVKEEAKDESS
ncbi:MAG: hypothetical protein Q9162_006036 [Coniocarpon cinnabarinum]